MRTEACCPHNAPCWCMLIQSAYAGRMKRLHALVWAAFLGTLATAAACGGGDSTDGTPPAGDDASTGGDGTNGDALDPDAPVTLIDDLTIDPTAATLTVTDPAVQ